MSELTDKLKASISKWAGTFFNLQNLLTYSLFVLLATFIWMGHALNTTRENTFHVPLNYEGIADSIAFTTPLPQHIDVRLRDQGSRLHAYNELLSRPITLDLSQQLPNPQKQIHISADLIRPRLNDLLQGTTKLQEITPEDVVVQYYINSSKQVPIAIKGQITPAKQYELSTQPTIKPAYTIIYGQQTLLDTIDTVYTSVFNLSNVKDTAIGNLTLEPIKGVSFKTQNVEITAVSERYTEKVLTLPITTRNVPDGKTLRLFPNTAEIRLKVSLRHFANVNEQTILPYVNYPTSPSDRLHVYIEHDTLNANVVRITPPTVEYIVEQQ